MGIQRRARSRITMLGRVIISPLVAALCVSLQLWAAPVHIVGAIYGFLIVVEFECRKDGVTAYTMYHAPHDATFLGLALPCTKLTEFALPPLSTLYASFDHKDATKFKQPIRCLQRTWSRPNISKFFTLSNYFCFCCLFRFYCRAVIDPSAC